MHKTLSLKFFISGLLALVLSASGCTFENTRTLSDADAAYITPFEEVQLVGAHDNPWGETHHPVVGATPIDVDGNGALEIFLGGGEGHADMLFFYENGKLVNNIDGRGLSDTHATYGANSIDLDNDGDTDLIVARSNGVFWYENRDGNFTAHAIKVTLPENSAALNVAVGDIDGDGDGDLYISAFVDLATFRSATFNDPIHAKTNILLENLGDNNFADITEEAGVASLQNTFLSAFMDLDGDKKQDLVVAQNTGQVEIFRNDGDNVFSPRPLSTGWGFWMGLAAGDIDKDGDQDLFFTNSGNSIPATLLETIGDGLDSQPRNYGWILLRNDGDFNFMETTADYQLNDYGFAWGAAFEDLTLDGNLELLVAQNYIKWPFHHWSKLSGKTFVLKNGAFYHARQLGLENPHFAQSPLITDINGDGRPDVFWVNMQGKGRAFINRSPNNYMTLLFPDTVESISARAYITTRDGKSYVREIHNNTGLSTDQWTGLAFGIGAQTAIEQAVIEWADGRRQVIDNPPMNTIINLE